MISGRDVYSRIFWDITEIPPRPAEVQTTENVLELEGSRHGLEGVCRDAFNQPRLTTSFGDDPIEMRVRVHNQHGATRHQRGLWGLPVHHKITFRLSQLHHDTAENDTVNQYRHDIRGRQRAGLGDSPLNTLSPQPHVQELAGRHGPPAVWIPLSAYDQIQELFQEQPKITRNSSNNPVIRTNQSFSLES